MSNHRDEGWFSSSSSSSSSFFSSEDSFWSSSSDSEEPPTVAANTKKRKRALGEETLPRPEISASAKRARLESKVWNEDWGYGADFIQWQQRHSVDGATLDLTNTETTVAPKDKESDTEVIDLLE